MEPESLSQLLDRIDGELVLAVARKVMTEASIKGEAEIKELRRRARISRAKMRYWENLREKGG